MKNVAKCLITLPRYWLTRSGSPAPWLRIDIPPMRKSWTAPPRMQPSTTQRNTCGPHNAPMIGPNTGPSPAMFKSWIR